MPQSSSAVGTEDLSFVHSWLDRSYEQFLEQLSHRGILVLGLMEVGILLAARDPVKNVLLITNGIMIILAIFRISIKKIFKFKRIKFITVLLTVNNLGYLWSLNSLLAMEGSFSSLMPIIVLNIFSSGISIIINTLRPFGNAIFAILLTIIPIAIFGASGIHDNSDLFDHFLALGFWNTLAFSIYYWRFQSGCRAALLERSHEELFKKSEQLKLESLEHELLLAQEIQDSISIPAGFTIAGGLSGHFFQKKHGFLGGDWMGSFQDSRNRVHIVIVDATGKGVPAALVVHAVQSLWAAASSDPDFEPIPWITDLNKTLLTLGQKSPQTLSLGLITISGKMVSYLSAGHVPLYFVTKHSEVEEIRSMSSRGNILGVGEELNLVSETIDLERSKALWVIGGTDGVFVSGTRLSPRGANQMLQKILDRKPEDLMATEAKDDKILLLLEKSA